MNYTAIVPARSGSKRLPNKNIRLLATKPLVVWTLEACVNVNYINTVILSTDSMDYWDLVKQYINSDKLELDYRDKNDAGDTVKIFDYLKNKRNKIFKYKKGAFILALPTVPLRNSNHIYKAISLFEETNCPVFSATEYAFPISFAFTLNEDKSWSPLIEDNPMITGNTRSQNQQVTYHPNGAIYIRNISDLADQKLMTLYTNAKPLVMSNLDSIDIDNEIDFRLAEALINKT